MVGAIVDNYYVDMSMKPQDMSILVKPQDMSILLHKFGCCACHVARQVVDVLTGQKGNSLTVI